VARHRQPKSDKKQLWQYLGNFYPSRAQTVHFNLRKKAQFVTVGIKVKTNEPGIIKWIKLQKTNFVSLFLKGPGW
jgi:hypothetical protein